MGINNRWYQLYIFIATNCCNYFKVSTLNKCTIVDIILDTNYYWKSVEKLYLLDW